MKIYCRRPVKIEKRKKTRYQKIQLRCDSICVMRIYKSSHQNVILHMPGFVRKKRFESTTLVDPGKNVYFRSCPPVLIRTVALSRVVCAAARESWHSGSFARRMQLALASVELSPFSSPPFRVIFYLNTLC